MTKYEKPIITINNELAEGVYMGSGNQNTCYSVNAYIHQIPETGRNDYRIQVNGFHNATHACNEQILTLTFNQSVNYVSSNGSYVSGNGTNSIRIKYNYWNNPKDNIGLGDVVVTSNYGLAITNAILSDENGRK